MAIQRYDATPDGAMVIDDCGGYVTIDDYSFLERRFRAFVQQTGIAPEYCQCTDGDDGLPLIQCNKCPR